MTCALSHSRLDKQRVERIRETTLNTRALAVNFHINAPFLDRGPEFLVLTMLIEPPRLST